MTTVTVLPNVTPPGVSTNVAVVPSATFNRPANTTLYSANQIVGQSSTLTVSPMVFAAARSPGNGGVVQCATLAKSSTGTAGASFRAHFFDQAPPTLTGLTDQSSYSSPKIADYQNYMGYADFTTPIAGSDGVWFQATLSQPVLVFAAASNSTSVYAVLQTLSSYAPASGETFDLRIGVTQN